MVVKVDKSKEFIESGKKLVSEYPRQSGINNTKNTINGNSTHIKSI